jgi:hypothetical protein
MRLASLILSHQHRVPWDVGTSVKGMGKGVNYRARCRTPAAVTRSADLRTGVKEALARFVTETPTAGKPHGFMQIGFPLSICVVCPPQRIFASYVGNGKRGMAACLAHSPVNVLNGRCAAGRS